MNLFCLALKIVHLCQWFVGNATTRITTANYLLLHKTWKVIITNQPNYYYYHCCCDDDYYYNDNDFQVFSDKHYKP